jgi:hypothetical protein
LLQSAFIYAINCKSFYGLITPLGKERKETPLLSLIITTALITFTVEKKRKKKKDPSVR